MRLRVRLTLVFGLLGLVTIASVTSLAWLLAAREIRASIDAGLIDQMTRLEAIGRRDLDEAVVEELRDRFGAAGEQLRPPVSLFESGEDGFQLLSTDGHALGEDSVPVTDAARAHVAAGESGLLETVGSADRTYRVLTMTVAGSSVAAERLSSAQDAQVEVSGLQLFTEISAEEAALSALGLRLAAASFGGLAVVAIGSWFVGTRLADPLGRVTAAARRLADLEDLPGRIEIGRTDEIGSLATSFNQMLSALEVAREQQRRLVADASHELRTPLTSLRLRTEFLARRKDIPADAVAMLDAAVADVEQLSALVSDLVDLAADVRSDDEAPERLQLATIIDSVVARSRTATGRCIVSQVDDTEAVVRAGMVRRAVQNLVDNAVKYSPDPEPIVVRSERGRIEVIDRGPGIAPEDEEHVFDRFYRSPKARSRPGNGIGLAIVHQVATAHGGDTWVAAGDGSGARVGFSVSAVS